MPEGWRADAALHEKILKRKLESLDYLIAILDQESKFSPHVYRGVGRIDWESLEALPWTEDQLLAIQWMKTIWTEEMHVVPVGSSSFWPRDYELREAIVTALAVDGYVPYLIEGYRSPKSARKTFSFLTGSKSA